jgi:uncharacterized protein YkwD
MNRNNKALLKIIFVFISCLLCLTGNSQSGERDALSDRSSRSNIDIRQLEKKIHELINKERAKRGLSVLSWDKSLYKVARNYSRDMVERNFFSHNDPDGSSFYDRYKAERIDCRIRVDNTTCMGAENIAQDNLVRSNIYKNGEKFSNWSTEGEIAKSVVKLWMNSKGHRANILTPYFKRQGIGVAISDDGKVYVTENFC